MHVVYAKQKSQILLVLHKKKTIVVFDLKESQILWKYYKLVWVYVRRQFWTMLWSDCIGMWMSVLKTAIVYVFESIIALAITYLCVQRSHWKRQTFYVFFFIFILNYVVSKKKLCLFHSDTLFYTRIRDC